MASSFSTPGGTLQEILVEIRLLNERTFAAQTAAAAGEVEAVGNAAEKTGKKMKVASFNAGLFGKAFGLMTKAAKIGALAVVASVGVAIDSGINFQQEMAKVASITRGAVGSTFKQMNQAALEAATTTRFSAKDAAESMYLLGRAGFSAKEELRALPGVLNLAHAAAVPLSLASEVMGETLRGFNLQAKDAALVTDTLARATAGGAVGLTDLRYSIKYIGSMASATHQPLAQMVALLELMARHGIKGSQAGTTLRSMMTRLTRPVKMVTDGLALLGMTAADYKGPKGLLPLDQIFNTIRAKMKLLDPNTANKAVAQIFGQWASSGAFAVLNAPKGQLEGFMAALDPKKVKGSAHKIASILNDTIQMQLLRLWHSLQAIGIGFSLGFGGMAKGPLKNFNDRLQSVVKGMEGLRHFAEVGQWHNFAVLLDILVGGNGRLAYAIDLVRQFMSRLWRVVSTELWPVFKDLAIVVGVTLFLAFLAINELMGLFADHSTTAKVLIWGLIAAYTAWKLVTWAATAATKINTWVNEESTTAKGWNTIATWFGFEGWTAMTAAIWANTVALLANPITWIVVGIVLLCIALYLAYTRWKAFHDVVDRFFNFLWDHWELISMVPVVGQMIWAIGEIIKHWGTLAAFFRHPIAGVEHMWDWLKNSFRDALNWLIKLWNSIASKFAFSTPNFPGTHTGGINFGGLPKIGLIGSGDDTNTAAPVPGVFGSQYTSMGSKFPPKVLEPFGPQPDGLGGLMPPIHTSVILDGKTIATAVHKREANTKARH